MSLSGVTVPDRSASAEPGTQPWAAADASRGAIALERVSRVFGGGVVAVDQIDLTVRPGEFFTLLGPSGCGKTTLLRMIAGFEVPDSGRILVSGREMQAVPAHRRPVNTVFQSYALFPHLNVADNIGFGLRMRGVAKPERKLRVDRIMALLQIDGFAARNPAQLSGGQRQRVAIGRAIVRNPKGFLFDEPLSNLDAALRVQMRTELVKLNKQLQTTMIYVTHDQIEAMTMADRIVVLNAGIVEQVGSPLELYNNPANLFVAGFIGSPKMNLLEGVVTARDDRHVEVALDDAGSVSVVAEGIAAAPGTRVTVGMRPEHTALVADGPIGGIADFVEHLGNETLVYVKRPDGRLLIVKADDLAVVHMGDAVSLAPKGERSLLFGPEGKALLRRAFHLH